MTDSRSLLLGRMAGLVLEEARFGVARLNAAGAGIWVLVRTPLPSEAMVPGLGSRAPSVRVWNPLRWRWALPRSRP